MTGIGAYRDLDVAVLGLARSGLATARALLAAGARVHVMDDRDEALAPALAIGAVRGTAESLPAMALMVVSPGVPLTHPEPHPLIRVAQAAGVKLTSDIDLLAEGLLPGQKLIAITGTNGKSTTTALVHHLLVSGGLDARLGGNIGRAVLDLEPGEPDTIYVLELSSFQLDLCDALRPDIALWLNLTPDHLDRHGDLDGYIRAKARIFARQQAGDRAVVGTGDAPSRAMAAALAARPDGPLLVPVAVGAAAPSGVQVLDGMLVDATGAAPRTIGDLHELPRLKGAHNWQNAAAATAAVLPFLDPARIWSGLRTFQGLAHRMEQVADQDGVLWVNDSKATNPDAAAKSLGAFSDILWIAGGKPKPGGFRDLLPHLGGVRRGFLIGQATDELLHDLGGTVDLRRSGTLEQALDDAAATVGELGLAHAVVLLAPACASFDQFRSFEHRGDRFRELVRSKLGMASA